MINFNINIEIVYEFFNLVYKFQPDIKIFTHIKGKKYHKISKASKEIDSLSLIATIYFSYTKIFDIQQKYRY